MKDKMQNYERITEWLKESETVEVVGGPGGAKDVIELKGGPHKGKLIQLGRTLKITALGWMLREKRRIPKTKIIRQDGRLALVQELSE